MNVSFLLYMCRCRAHLTDCRAAHVESSGPRRARASPDSLHLFSGSEAGVTGLGAAVSQCDIDEQNNSFILVWDGAPQGGAAARIGCS